MPFNGKERKGPKIKVDLLNFVQNGLNKEDPFVIEMEDHELIK